MEQLLPSRLERPWPDIRYSVGICLARGTALADLFRENVGVDITDVRRDAHRHSYDELVTLNNVVIDCFHVCTVVLFWNERQTP